MRVDVHFDDFPAVGEDSGSFADDFGGEDEVLQDLVVDVGQGSGHGARLLLTTVAAGFGHDTALADEHDMAVREFLLELTSQSIRQQVTSSLKAG